MFTQLNEDSQTLESFIKNEDLGFSTFGILKRFNHSPNIHLLDEFIGYVRNRIEHASTFFGAYSNASKIKLLSSIDELVVKSNPEKEEFLKKADSILSEKNPVNYYQNMLYFYNETLKEVISLYDTIETVKILIPHTEGSNGKNFLTNTNARNLLNHEQRQKVKGINFSEKTINEIIQDLEFQVVDQNSFRNNVHKEITAYAKEKLGKDYGQVYLDILLIQDPLNALGRRSKESYFDRPYYDKLLEMSGNKKISVFFGSMTINSPYHEGENHWSIEPGQIGYTDLQVRGPPWGGDQVQLSFDRLNNLSRNRDNVEVKYYSRVENGSEEKDMEIIHVIKGKYPKYISFAGFAPCLYDHGKSTFKNVIEINYERISKDKKEPDIFIEQMFDFIRLQIQGYNNIPPS